MEKKFYYFIKILYILKIKFVNKSTMNNGEKIVIKFLDGRYLSGKQEKLYFDGGGSISIELEEKISENCKWTIEFSEQQNKDFYIRHTKTGAYLDYNSKDELFGYFMAPHQHYKPHLWNDMG